MKTALAILFSLISVSTIANSQTTKNVPVSLALNWKAEPEFGGFYAGDLEKSYQNRGINITITEGGSGTPTVQMLANGKTDFAVVSADEIILSQDRNPKNKIVALFAVYQTAPYIIMTHAEKNFKNIKEVFESPGTLSMQSGLPYYQFLVNKLGKPKANVVPYLGGVANFVNDKNFSQQGFITTEPLSAEKAGAKVKSFLIADEGFNPYLVVLAAREETIKKNPELIKKMIEATREGWDKYLNNPSSTQNTNKHMAGLNKALDLATFDKSADVQKPLIVVKGTALGSMTDARWNTLVKQLKDLKQIKSDIPAKNLYLP